MLVLVETGRVPVTTKAILGRLQERWPTEHGYAPQVIEESLEALRQAGSIHCSVSGRWTRTMKVNETPAAPAADPVADEPGPLEADNTTQEIEVAGKTKVCKGKCGKEKPVGEFYTNCSSCKRCVLDRQKELKAVKAGHPGPPVSAPGFALRADWARSAPSMRTRQPSPAKRRSENGRTSKRINSQSIRISARIRA